MQIPKSLTLILVLNKMNFPTTFRKGINVSLAISTNEFAEVKQWIKELRVKFSVD